jgi:excisionase family DNA binding protein
MSRALLDTAGAAELLNVPKSWVASEVRAERIPHIRLGRYVRFDPDDLREWSKGRRRGPRPQNIAAEGNGREGLAR